MKFKFLKYEIIIVIIALVILISLILFVLLFHNLNYQYQKLKIIDNKQLIFETHFNLSTRFKINDILTLKIDKQEILAKLLNFSQTDNGNFLFKIQFINNVSFFKFSDVYLKIITTNQIIKFFG
ncbi:hypothetical protein [Mycoplasma miroungirhinis]|uniref:Transmembrane protein n=1 Tax=Mycoplasma miroungirhinis TaxID=754516 RepID=A0A6M4JIX9_9MOLU|nr:hypothetical protein [Mycoplasma miroungirhinis]QJR44431.1 hypothetical protein HLA92_03270 [Mycoplasma miroungirhinis]